MKVYVIQVGNRFLNASDEVKAATIWGGHGTATFDTEDEATAKIAALGLARARVIPTTKRD